MNLYGGFTGSVDTYSTAGLGVILTRVLGPPYEIFNLMPTWQEIAAHTQLKVAFGGLALSLLAIAIAQRLL